MSHGLIAFHSNVLQFQMHGSNVIAQDTHKNYTIETHGNAHDLTVTGEVMIGAYPMKFLGNYRAKATHVVYVYMRIVQEIEIFVRV